ncbi:hypothetical protein CU098_001672 [Rhizopus stolonifer]|uniref:HIT-type domain-containing protein n=1 Tax=Rhizopus stolonifer TaxID=4846 RepID=A0A367K0J2_RHIST|nr:hypothetical protein CU098_001672 [Rhizopus stolonifer]
MPTLKIIDDQDKALEPVNQTLCEICQKQFSNYVCPRCNLRYCSLTCYKDLKHADCTESFYRESVTAEIQTRELDKNDKNKMLAMLQRLEQENQALDLDDDDHYESMLDRFSQIDIEHTDANVIWDLLSDQERKEFEHVLHNVEKTGDWHAWHLPSYSPWWEASSLIQEQDQSIPGPVLPASLPDFTRLTQPATRSSPHIVWNGLSILATYSYLMRHAMGDLLEDTRDTLCLCEVLSANVLFSNAATCPYEGVEDVVGDVVARIIDWEDKATTRPSFNHIRRYDLKLLLLHDLEVLQKESKRAIFDFWHTMDCISKQTRKKKVISKTWFN